MPARRVKTLNWPAFSDPSRGTRETSDHGLDEVMRAEKAALGPLRLNGRDHPSTSEFLHWPGAFFISR